MAATLGLCAIEHPLERGAADAVEALGDLGDLVLGLVFPAALVKGLAPGHQALVQIGAVHLHGHAGAVGAQQHLDGAPIRSAHQHGKGQGGQGATQLDDLVAQGGILGGGQHVDHIGQRALQPQLAHQIPGLVEVLGAAAHVHAHQLPPCRPRHRDGRAFAPAHGAAHDRDRDLLGQPARDLADAVLRAIGDQRRHIGGHGRKSHPFGQAVAFQQPLQQAAAGVHPARGVRLGALGGIEQQQPILDEGRALHHARLQGQALDALGAQHPGGQVHGEEGLVQVVVEIGEDPAVAGADLGGEG